MVLVDSTVWIDYFNGKVNDQSNALDTLLGVDNVAMGDLILLEILQGFRSEEQFLAAEKSLSTLHQFELLGKELAVRAASNCRFLQEKGVSTQKTAVAIIATFCIDKHIPLLFKDDGFLSFVRYLGLKSYC